MKKSKFFVIFAVMFMFNSGVVFATNSVSISSNTSKISVGKSTTVTAVVSSDSPLVSIEGTLKCTGSGSGSVSMSFDDSSNSVKSKSFSLTVTGNSTGTINCSVSGVRITNMSSDSWINLSANPISIKVENSSTNNSTSTTVKSSINYLSSLSIEGVELSPVFDKETTEYEVTLESGTTSVNVSGTKESSVSYVTGLGDIPVSEGANYISIVVTAENGAKRTYIIKATVLEEDPVIVNIDNQEKTLIRKTDAMPTVSDYYVSSIVNIDGVEIPCYINEVTGYTLVALKDEQGNVNLYRYDSATGSYFDYSEYGFDFVKISLLEPSFVPDGYVLGTVVINEREVSAYLKDSSLPLLYGVNLETGEENFYSYDASENTIQRFIIDDSLDYTKYYPYIIIGLCGLALFEFIVIISVTISKNKKLKKALRKKLDTKTDYEKSFDSKKNTVYKDEKNITDDLTDEYMSSDSTNQKSDEKLGHTAMISNSVNNVYDNSKNKKEKKKSKKRKGKNDDMFHF